MTGRQPSTCGISSSLSGNPVRPGSGATFLHEWLMVYDPSGESLLCKALRSDV